ncbi:succinylglutamate desuccinylase/aspartoacylase family protein [Muricauda oceani]|uniref:Succinylglutamate desuccinylase n=1 Tax=Flagellimonas oceani TaxID=2698672 RepID=A0A6G7J799_9FLAO|nr:succinylglutamate desuccinylase/aspartoacylase family protein [Allomuricauda oceani]MBW8241822.1 succinylglutamate desuccinylase/aspartoacylase family protein [Allomuricauda oceani]QII46743.1 succinylglutamate desuccinylase [Allomuricauda oceani]
METARVIGEYGSGASGPLLLVTAGIHGNEPSGVVALQHIFKELQKCKPDINGCVVGIAGNREALKKNVRYIDEDLNRIWTRENLQNDVPKSSEQKEMCNIMGALNRYPKTNYSKRYFLDCHTTSSDSLPYISVQDVNDNLDWAGNFPTYIVRGFSDLIKGDIDHYLSSQGITGFVFEGGQHQSETAVANHEGIIWLAIKKALGLDLTSITRYPECVENFKDKNAPEQKIFDIVHRHSLKEQDDFKMEPGFKNFTAVKEGQLLAYHNNEQIRSGHNGHIFLPLYQSKGNDGFFIIKEIGN